MRRLLIMLATVLATLAAGPPAHASGRDVIDDCTLDEVLSKTYTQKEYRDALANLPSDADQYGACRDIIARAQDAAATRGGSKGKGGGGDGGDGGADSGGGSSAGGSSGGGDAQPAPSSAKDQLAAASDADRAAVDEATRNAPEVSVGPSDSVSAANVGRAPDTGRISDLPAPLLALLALLAAGGLALGGMRIRSLVRARRT